MRILKTMLLMAVLNTAVGAQSYREGAFILEDIGARNLGVGGAMTALANDIGALYTNPAGLSSVDQYTSFLEIGNSHAEDQWAAVSFAIPIQKRATLALGYRGFRTNSQSGVSRLTNSGTYRNFGQPLEEDDSVLEIAFGRFVRSDLSVGAGFKYLRFHASSLSVPFERSTSYYGNLGVRYNSAIKGIVLGARVDNIGTKVQGPPSTRLPLTTSVGLSWGRLRSTAHYVVLSADLVKIEDQSLGFKAGAEYWFANLMAIRAGYNGVDSKRPGYPYQGQWSMGMSLSFRGTLFDFVAIPSPENTKVSGSLRMTFGEGRKSRRNKKR